MTIVQKEKIWKNTDKDQNKKKEKKTHFYLTRTETSTFQKRDRKRRRYMNERKNFLIAKERVFTYNFQRCRIEKGKTF